MYIIVDVKITIVLAVIQLYVNGIDLLRRSKVSHHRISIALFTARRYASMHVVWPCVRVSVCLSHVSK